MLKAGLQQYPEGRSELTTCSTDLGSAFRTQSLLLGSRSLILESPFESNRIPTDQCLRMPKSSNIRARGPQQDVCVCVCVPHAKQALWRGGPMSKKMYGRAYGKASCAGAGQETRGQAGGWRRPQGCNRGDGHLHSQCVGGASQAWG